MHSCSIYIICAKRQLCIVVVSTLSVLRGNYTYTYTHCAPLLADLFISLFVPTKIYFILGYLTKNGKKLAKSLGLQQTKSNAMDAGTTYHSEAPEITTIFCGVCVVRSVVSR
jgi:hypothetical protein